MAQKQNQVKLRQWARFFPSLGWAIGLDALDAIPVAVSWIPAVNVAADFTMDALQAILGLIIFEDQKMWLAGSADIILPPGLDIFPSFTAMHLSISLGIIK